MFWHIYIYYILRHHAHTSQNVNKNCRFSHSLKHPPKVQNWWSVGGETSMKLYFHIWSITEKKCRPNIAIYNPTYSTINNIMLLIFNFFLAVCELITLKIQLIYHMCLHCHKYIYIYNNKYIFVEWRRLVQLFWWARCASWCIYAFILYFLHALINNRPNDPIWLTNDFKMTSICP